MTKPVNAQALSVKRAQVEFHNFASLGEPDRAFAVYAEENVRRGAIIRRHLEFIGPMSPFLEIGANAGHTSYMLANEFGAYGFALDISADALRHGIALQDRWHLPNAPVRIAGDAANLPFADNSLRMVLAFQMLSQFMDIERVLVEVKRVLMPGGIFLFAEEPMRRLLSLHLYRCPYYENMKPWERKLYDWGLLGYIARDVIGAHQEESFGIRQNHRFYLPDWHRLLKKHFSEHEYELFVPERGWGERVAKKLAIRLDPYRSTWRAARLLGGTLAAVCRKAGDANAVESNAVFHESFGDLLRCPDCHASLRLRDSDTLACESCGYSAADEGSVFNLLPSAERKELYPGERDDVMDVSVPSHSALLREGWYDVEGVFGNKFRWIGGRASLLLRRVNSGPQRVRIRGHAQDNLFQQGRPATVNVLANGQPVGSWTLDRTGLFVLEADVPDAADYAVEIQAAPEWSAPGDQRRLTLTLSMIRLIPVE